MGAITRVRLAFTALAVLLAVVSLAAAGSNVAVKTDPELALRMWPANGTAAAMIADRALLMGIVRHEEKPGSEKQLYAQSAAFAFRSLDALALNPIAVRTIALAKFDGGPEQIRLLQQGARLSRRDSLTQLWLINDAAAHGRSARALAHYDALLRAGTPFRDLAGRTLAHALSERTFVDPIAKLLREDPPWKSVLFHYAVQDRAAWDGFIALHRKLSGSAVIPADTSAQFAAALVAAGRIADASSVAELAGARPLVRTSALIDGRFTASSTFPGAWEPTAGQESALQPLAEGGALLTYTRGPDGPLARRLVALVPGTYTARVQVARSRDGDSGPDSAQAALEARLECARAGAPSGGSPKFTVETNCPYQWLTIALLEPMPYDGQVVLRSVVISRGG